MEDVIIFSSQGFSERGTEVALYDYAHYNELLLNNKSIITQPFDFKNSYDIDVTKKFNNRFIVEYFKNQDELDNIVVKYNAKYRYEMKFGLNDSLLTTKAKNLIHCVFDLSQPHGDKYIAISEWLSNKKSSGKIPFVSYMIDLPEINENLRTKLNIPLDAIVFGRYGGFNDFNVHFVYNVIQKILKEKNNIYFLFMNTQEFLKHPNIIYLSKNIDLDFKVKFINTCDAMLHARLNGESFGLACGEFSIKNKPIITWNGGLDAAHLDILGEKALIYNNAHDLYDIINSIKELISLYDNWDCYSNKFNPNTIMKRFKEVFLDD